MLVVLTRIKKQHRNTECFFASMQTVQKSGARDKWGFSISDPEKFAVSSGGTQV